MITTQAYLGDGHSSMLLSQPSETTVESTDPPQHPRYSLNRQSIPGTQQHAIHTAKSLKLSVPRHRSSKLTLTSISSCAPQKKAHTYMHALHATKGTQITLERRRNSPIIATFSVVTNERITILELNIIKSTAH